MAPTQLTLSIDQTAPVATWLNPRAGGTTLELPAYAGTTPLSIELADAGGSGINPATLVPANVLVTRNGTTLVFGRDYSFGYNSFGDASCGDVNGQATRIDFNGSAWAGQYQITISGLADRAGNVMATTQLSLSIDRSDRSGGHMAEPRVPAGTTLELPAYAGGTPISIELADAGGSGINPATLLPANVVVTRNGTTLVFGRDYGEAFNSFPDASCGDVNGQATRIDLNAQVWAGQYQISISGVADRAGNVMAPILLSLSVGESSADQTAPVATWLNPRAIGTALQLAAVKVGTISIELADAGGSGIDLTTVTSANVIVTRGGKALVFGKDYSFGISSFTDSFHGDVNGQVTRIDLNPVWAGAVSNHDPGLWRTRSET